MLITLVRKLRRGAEYRGDARLYQLSEPVEVYDGDGPTDYVVISATILPDFSRSETAIFAADIDGKILDYEPIRCSWFTLQHTDVIADAGWTLA